LVWNYKLHSNAGDFIAHVTLHQAAHAAKKYSGVDALLLLYPLRERRIARQPLSCGRSRRRDVEKNTVEEMVATHLGGWDVQFGGSKRLGG
jgi:hypothetical protein